MADVTQILKSANEGDPLALRSLFATVYEELRVIAARQMADERAGQTIQPTALVHEAFIKLLGSEQDIDFANRRHFFAAAAEAMRRILIDHARKRSASKRGGERIRIDGDLSLLANAEQDERLLALDEALERFAAIQPQKAELIKLCWFAGMTLEQAANLLGISPTTADRWWAYSRAWLRAETNQADD